MRHESLEYGCILWVFIKKIEIQLHVSYSSVWCYLISQQIGFCGVDFWRIEFFGYFPNYLIQICISWLMSTYLSQPNFPSHSNKRNKAKNMWGFNAAFIAHGLHACWSLPNSKPNSSFRTSIRVQDSVLFHQNDARKTVFTLPRH